MLVQTKEQFPFMTKSCIFGDGPHIPSDIPSFILFQGVSTLLRDAVDRPSEK
jgi:hypothetical protein